MRKTKERGMEKIFKGNPKELAEKFITDVEKVLNKQLMGFIVGSVRDGKYVAGKSDIDIVICACDETILTPREYLKIYELGRAYGEKYGMVKKNGRLVSIIDPMLFLSEPLSEQGQQLVKKLADDGKLIPVSREGDYDWVGD